MAAFTRLQGLGEEKFGKILNALMRGEPCAKIARWIQQAPPDGWGDFQGVAETTVMQQLNRLRRAAADGVFGAKESKRITEIGRPNIDRLAEISIPVLARAEELSDKQRELVMVLLNKAIKEERTYTSVNDAVANYEQNLLNIQKLRFDLGLDEWKGPASTTLKAGVQTTTLPDGTSIQKQVFEAVRAVEHIFEQRGISIVNE